MNQNSKTQKEIEEIREKDFKRLLIILLPFLLLFIIEHFGEFKFVGSPYYGNDTESKSYISGVNYETPFGSEFSEDLRGEKPIFTFLYNNKFPFYIKGAFEDIWYAVIPSLIILMLFLYNKFLLSKVSKQTSSNEEEKDINYLTNAIDNLKELKDKGILNEEEYNLKSEKIQSEKLENQILNSTEYLQLKNLYDLKVLSKEEFESKVELVKSTLIEPIEKVEEQKTIDQQILKIDEVNELTNNEKYTEGNKNGNSNNNKILLFVGLSSLFILVLVLLIERNNRKDTQQEDPNVEAAPVEEVAPVEYYYEETEEVAPVEDSTEELNQESSHQNTNNAMANRIYVFVVISYKQDVGSSTFFDKSVSEITEYPEYTFTDEEGYRLIDKFYAERRLLALYTITDRKYLSFKSYKEASIEREKFLKKERIEIDNRRQPINYTPQIHTF